MATVPIPYAELHAHTNFSFLDGASAPDDLVERAVELGLTGLAVTDHNGLYGAVRFTGAAEEAGLHPVIGIEIELLDAGRRRIRRAWSSRPRRRPSGADGRAGHRTAEPTAVERAARPDRDPSAPGCPGHRDPVKEDLRGIGAAGARAAPRAARPSTRSAGGACAGSSRGPTWPGRRACRGSATPSSTSITRASSPCRAAATGRSPGGCWSATGRAPGRPRSGMPALRPRRRSGDERLLHRAAHHLLPDDDWLVAESAALAAELGLPVVVTNDVHYARPEDRELHDVLTAIRHGRTLDTLADLRRPDGESYLKSGDELAGARRRRSTSATGTRLARGDRRRRSSSRRRARSTSGSSSTASRASRCRTGRRRSRTCRSCAGRAPGRRYHPLTPAVVKRLAHELDVIERAGLAEFFLICWDLMRFAKERGIPAQGRGSATSSIVSYTLGISRVEPIAHNLLFERFINPGRTTYPDVDIDFSSERREEVIQYIYGRYGPEHTGMVCNLVTYRARSAVREVGYALGFPRPLVDRVAKALETYD